MNELYAFAGDSAFINERKTADLQAVAGKSGLGPEQITRETMAESFMEGLYIKVEDEERVQERYKFIRSDFLKTLLDSGSHWRDRPLLSNLLEA